MCDWSFNSIYDYYETECGEVFCFTDDLLLKESNFNFCPYCGKKINQIEDRILDEELEEKNE